MDVAASFVTTVLLPGIIGVFVSVVLLAGIFRWFRRKAHEGDVMGVQAVGASAHVASHGFPWLGVVGIAVFVVATFVLMRRGKLG